MQPIIDVIEGYRVIKHPYIANAYCVLRPASYSSSSSGHPPIFANRQCYYDSGFHMIPKDSDYAQTYFSLEDIAELIENRKQTYVISLRPDYRLNNYGVENSPIREHIQCNPS